MVKLIILFLIMYKKILLFALILLASCSKTAEKEKEVIIETRVFERKVGYVLFNPRALIAKKVRGKWGRYIKFRTFMNHPVGSQEFHIDADCVDYTADLKGDNKGWVKLKVAKNDFSQETRKILDEFCPQMDKLVEVAKDIEMKGYQTDYFSYPATTAKKNGNSGGGGVISSQTDFNSIRIQNQINSQKFNNNLNNNVNRLNQELMRNQQFNTQQQQNMNNFRMQQNQLNQFNSSPYKY